MTEIKAQFVQFFSNLFNYRSASVTDVTEPQDDSLESLHRLSCKGEISALLKLGLTAQRSAHAYAEYLFADALKTINRYPLLMSYYYYRAFKTGSVSDDEKQKKGAFLVAQALADCYDAGLYFPKNALFADHYRYEAACLNPDVGQAFLQKLTEKEGSVSEIKLLQLSLISLSLGYHEYAEKWLQTALERPLPTVITYFTALKNKIYIALGKRYEASSDYTTAVHYYEKIKPQNAKELIYPFQAANIAFYTLNQPQQAIAILANTQPEMTLPNTTEKKDFFDYLFRWEKAWKAKEIIEFKKSGKTQSRHFKESSVNPMIDVYLKTQQGEKMMSQEMLNYLEDPLSNVSTQAFNGFIRPFKQKSQFYQKIELILNHETNRFSTLSQTLQNTALYNLRIAEIGTLKKELRDALQPGNFYDDTFLYSACAKIIDSTQRATFLSNFARKGGNRLIEKLEELLESLEINNNMAYFNVALRETAQKLEANKIITKQSETIKNFESVLERKNIEIEKLSNGESLLEKTVEIDKLTQALNEKDIKNRSKNKLIKKQQKTITEQSETIHGLNKKIDEQSTEIQGLNLSISKLHGDLAKSEKKIQDLNQEIVEKTKAFEEKLENQVTAHAIELKSQATSHAAEIEAIKKELEKQSETHAIELDSIKKELEEKTKTFEEKLENQATSNTMELENQAISYAKELDIMKKSFEEQFQDLNKKISEQNKALRNAGTRNTKNENKIDEYETFIKDCGGETYILEMKENYENYKKDSALFKKYTSAKNVDTPFGKNQTMETLEDYDSLICPITEDMFKDPVVAEDGYTYERSKIEQWFLKRKTSPMTGEPMGIALVENISLRNIISDFLNYNKSKLEEESENQKKFVLTTEFVSEKKEPANNPHAFFSQSNSMPTETPVTPNFILVEEKKSVFSLNSF